MSIEYIKLLEERLGADLVETNSFRGFETALVRKDAWSRAIRILKQEGRLSMLTDLCGADYPDRAERFEVVAHLYSVEAKKRIRLKSRCTLGDASIPTCTDVFAAADWYEREAFDLFGIRFEGHPNLKRLLCHQQFEGHALRKDFPKERRGAIPAPDTLMDEMEGVNERTNVLTHERTIHDSRMFLNIGPSHPAMHGCFRVLVKLDGERISHSVPEIGYMHRGFEKEAEAHTWHQVIPYTDRLNYVSPMMNNVGYCMAVEQLFEIDIPERAKWIRMLVCEVSRIWDHLVAVGANLVDVGALTNFWYLFNAREEFTDWIEALCGARLTTTYARIGGLMRDIPAGSEKQLAACLKSLRKALKDVRALTQKNRILIDRTQGVGAISEDEAIDRGFTGPCLRATGCGYDVRRAHPYYFYDAIDWDVPVGTCGDTYDRIFVRMEEMEQSARIIEQVMARIPGGPIMTGRRDIALPQPHEVYGSIEGMMQQFKLVMHGMRPPAGEVYSYTEAANGELGFYIVSDGGERPYRIKVRPPCFPLYQAFPRLIQGHMIADAVAIMGSLNIIAGELDR
ncbi:MAG: NADH dehydrogenase (quinone) subunit D [bacterium]